MSGIARLASFFIEVSDSKFVNEPIGVNRGGLSALTVKGARSLKCTGGNEWRFYGLIALFFYFLSIITLKISC
jgi:hypothetical protein